VRQYWVYIVSNRAQVLYTGVTGDLRTRIQQHKMRLVPGFTSKYHLDRLVYFEETPNIRAAIAREKQIKGWRREKKIRLIEDKNPKWEDLSARF